MNINEFTQQTNYGGDYCSRPRIFCNDGFNMSVQGSKGHYCTPRSIESIYTSMEIGYPSETEDDLMEWVEDADRPTDTVYAYVPIEVIQRVIDKHGGIDEQKTFE